MIDIWGRPVSSTKPTTESRALDISKDVKKIIEDEIAEKLNLASVDPGEIVVFQDRQGKLKTSNVSLDVLLTKDPTAADGSIVIFDKGKLKPDMIISRITEPLNEAVTKSNDASTSLKILSDKYDNHITEYTQFTEFQKSIIDKIDKPLLEFLGNPPVTVPKLTEIKEAIDKLTKLKIEYDSHVTQFSMLRKNFNSIDEGIIKFFGKKTIKPNDVNLTLEEINTNITAIKEDFLKMAEIAEKIKIPHIKLNIKNIVYTVARGKFDWIKGTINEILKFEIPSTPGIYRCTIFHDNELNISDKPFSISGTTSTPKDDETNVGTIIKGLNNTAMFRITDSATKNTTVLLTITHPETIRESLWYTVEFVSNIPVI